MNILENLKKFWFIKPKNKRDLPKRSRKPLTDKALRDILLHRPLSSEGLRCSQCFLRIGSDIACGNVRNFSYILKSVEKILIKVYLTGVSVRREEDITETYVPAMSLFPISRFYISAEQPQVNCGCSGMTDVTEPLAVVGMKRLRVQENRDGLRYT